VVRLNHVNDLSLERVDVIYLRQRERRLVMKTREKFIVSPDRSRARLQHAERSAQM
jgi:hypothetical protein